MVTVDLSPTTADRIKLASALAKQFGGKLIGAAAREIRFPEFMPGKGLELGSSMLWNSAPKPI